MATFTELKIVELDEDISGKSKLRPSLNEYVFKLSDSAPYNWVSIFNRLWREHFYMMKRDVEICGELLTTWCSEEELQGLVNEMKPVITKANKEYIECLNQSKAVQEEEERKAQEESQRLKDIKRNLEL